MESTASVSKKLFQMTKTTIIYKLTQTALKEIRWRARRPSSLTSTEPCPIKDQDLELH